MKNFYSVADVPSVNKLVAEALALKNTAEPELTGRSKTLVMLLFNPSLRTRISTQKAAQELGMNVIAMNATDGWKWEMEDGTVMNMDTAEHIKDAAKVISQYADVIAIRAFPGLVDRAADYKDKLLRTFMAHAEVPVINLESSILHPCQSLADLMTIAEYQPAVKARIVLSWAPHPKALPQAVSNSFLEWVKQTDYELVLTHPPGYELAEPFRAGVQQTYDQEEALAGADFVYVKNWSSYQDYGKVLSQDESWTINAAKMALTQQAKLLHCLPIRRNLIVTDEVLDGPDSLIYQQANNRTHAAKIILQKLLTHD